MTVITRFNPNLNGGIHIGHIYAVLINERFAHSRGGRFVVRFDDTNRDAVNLSREKLDAIAAGQRADIEWLGIPVDQWEFQSTTQATILVQLEEFGYSYRTENVTPTLPTFVRMTATSWWPAPYTPQQTAERVLRDTVLGITHLIRGEELATETALYCYFCEQFKAPEPRFIYLPRLQGPRGDISKTNGGYTIADMRAAGRKPEEVITWLASACLYWRYNDWDLDNLRPNPQLTF